MRAGFVELQPCISWLSGTHQQFELVFQAGGADGVPLEKASPTASTGVGSRQMEVIACWNLLTSARAAAGVQITRRKVVRRVSDR